MTALRLALLLLITTNLITAAAQLLVTNPYDYAALSHLGAVKLRDSLRKNWVAPTVYKDKETQKKFKEFWDSRTDFVATAITNKNFIQEKETFQYVENIVSQLQKANPILIKQKPILLIDRSGAVNAYSMGSHLIAVNLGLIAFSSSREELALVMAHELAHDILNHAENSMKERAEWLTSDEYKKSLNQVLDSKYERYSRLKKLMEGYTFNRTRHNRYHESEADSLAVVMLKAANIGFDAKHFLRLDSADMQYRMPLKKPLKEYFTAMELPFDETWTQKKSKGLSSKAYNFKKTELDDSLKTHPDCAERYEKTKSSSTLISSSPIPAPLLARVNKMIVWNIFDSQNLTACLYRIFQEQDKGTADAWYEFMMYNVFAGLSYSDKQLERFNAINVISKEYISQHYYELQTMLEQMPRESMEQYNNRLNAAAFWQSLPPDARNMKGFFVSLLSKDASDKSKESAAKSFASSQPGSMYLEFADHFIVK